MITAMAHDASKMLMTKIILIDRYKAHNLMIKNDIHRYRCTIDSNSA